MDLQQGGAAAVTTGAGCGVCGKPVPVSEAGGRPRAYCSRACQSKRFRARQKEERDRLLAAAGSTRAETRSVPKYGTVDRLGPDPGFYADPEPSPRERVAVRADLLHRQAAFFLEELDSGREPGLGLGRLRYHAAVHLAQLFKAAREAAGELRTGGPDPWDEDDLVEFARRVAFSDPAGVPVVHLAQEADPEVSAGVPSPDPAVRFGRPDLAMPLVVEGVWEHWDVAGWKGHQEVMQVRYRQLVAGRVEQVGGQWLAVFGTGNGYLRVRTSRIHPLRWFPSAQAAAVTLALRQQDVWEPPAPSGLKTGLHHLL